MRIERDLGAATRAPAEEVRIAWAPADASDGQVGIGPRAAESPDSSTRGLIA